MFIRENSLVTRWTQAHYIIADNQFYVNQSSWKEEKKLEAGSWKLEGRRKKLEARSWKLEGRRKKLEARSWKLEGRSER
ncbi:MAG: hypothetical protein R6U62_02445 [Bacteroidales bacterium]